MNNQHTAAYLKKISVLVFTIFQLLGIHTAFAQNWGTYQEEVVVKVSGITTTSQIPALNNAQKQVTRQYTDGLGRPIQTIAIGASPAGKDIIQPMIYDPNLDRQSMAYLAYTGTDGSGGFHDNALYEQGTFYSTGQGGKVAIDASPFSKQVFDNSPLQRLLQAGSFGDGFQPGQHYKTAVYRYNLATDNVLRWSYNGVSSGSYNDNSLSAMQTTDEQGVSTIIFADNLGKTVLKRQLINETIAGVAENRLDTYYLYNDNGSLSYVIPPKAVVTMRNAANYNITQTGVDALIFKMVYDSRGRLAQKTVPGGSVLYMVYDPLNRPVLIQDGNMRAAHQWNYIKYDGKGRVISQGIYTDGVNFGQEAMQAYVDGIDYSTSYYEEASNTPINGGYYSNNVFPRLNNAGGGTALQPLTYAYFDTYDLDRNGTADFAYQVQGLANEASPSAQVRGRLTVISKTAIGESLTVGLWLTSATFYDSRGRAIQTQAANHTNASAALTDISTSAPDFTGKPLQSKIVKVLYGSTTTVLSSFQYDHRDRLLSVDQAYNGASAIRIGAYAYNELGQMITKNLHSKNAGSTFMQSVDYRFNIRGQMLSINNSTLTAGSNNAAGTSALFGMEFLYDKVDAAPNPLNNTPYFNGLISAVKWMAGTPMLTERSYKYAYDDQNRLQDANYADRATGQGAWGNFGAYDEHNISYDHNGNILTLKRNAIISGSIAGIDDLAYSYNDNKLNTVTDGIGSSYTSLGFKNRTGSVTPYTYDNQGNLLEDAYKGTSSSYNVLNRVSRVTVTTGTGRYINYTYDATAVLIRKQQYDNNALVKTTDYVDGFVAEDNVLSYFAMPEGRIINTGGTLLPEYFIADQQGNVRVSFQEQGTTGVAVVKQENSYYPFGLIMPNSQIATPSLANKQLYNGGSEWQNDFGDLPDLYQTYYRSYDAALGRFTGIDPKAELTESWSPYHYAGNNPVLYNDPMGDFYGSNGQYVSNRGIENFKRHQDGGGYANFNNWMNKTMERLNDPQAQTFDLAKSMGEKNTGVAVAVYADGHIEIDYGMPYSSYNVQTEVDGKYGWSYTRVNGDQEGATTSQYLAIWGVETAALENFAGKTQMGKWGKLYFENPATGRVFFGNQYAKVLNLAKTGRILGIAGGVVGMAFDGIGVYNYYHPTDKNVKSRVSPGKFGADAVITAVGIWGGPWGAGVSVLYFGIDAYAPGFWPRVGTFVNEMQRDNESHTNDLMWHVR